MKFESPNLEFVEKTAVRQTEKIKRKTTEGMNTRIRAVENVRIREAAVRHRRFRKHFSFRNLSATQKKRKRKR